MKIVLLMLCIWMFYTTSAQSAGQEKLLDKGCDAPAFEYPDQKGVIVSLSDFKGKIVVVDVWATWCPACIYEMPYLKKLEEDMKGKEVVFVGVTIDEQKNHCKWLEVLEKEQLGGVQLFANGKKAKIMQDYKIVGIPRFMVFDKDGKIISTLAPRASNPELKVLLEKELQK